MTPQQARIGALTRFSIAITVLNVLGHTVFGFETSVVQTLLCVFTAYAIEIILEIVEAWSENRKPLFLGGGLKQFVIFLMPAHITGLAISMLLYPGDRLIPYVFAVVVAMTSKAIFTVTVDGRRRHYLNPSNTGIVATIFLFPSVSIVVPYHFTENLYGFWDWALPGLIIVTGTLLNAVFTKKMPLILTWLASFVLQAIVRHFIYPTWLPGSLAPMTGVAFVLFTFYMVTDPQTSPSSVRGQVIFGFSVGTVYGLLIGHNIVFTMFFALFIVCVGRGMILFACERAPVRRAQAIVERTLLGFFGRPSLTSLPPASAERERLTQP
jgi:enediyne biosynthesis protein E5